MSQQNTPHSVLDRCNQIIIYGANGWMGRSALDFITSSTTSIRKEQILLIGSKTSSLEINGISFRVLDPHDSLAAIRENSIFFNAAFLRREFLQKMSPAEYVLKNEVIANFAKNVIKEFNLLSFINLSSGAARVAEMDSNNGAIDEYSKLKKKLELEYAFYCNQFNTEIVNCRIYNITGKFLNEFDNLAFSSFIKQAKSQNHIEVRSPMSKRTYVDATDLAGTLLVVGSLGKSVSFDSGGALVTMLETAEKIAEVVQRKDCKILSGNLNSPDYYGEYGAYNSLVSDLGIQHLGLENQILNSLKAFK